MFSVQNAIIVICEYMFWVHGTIAYLYIVYLYTGTLSFISKYR